MKTPLDIKRTHLRNALHEALPNAPGVVDRLADAIDAYAEAWQRETVDKAIELAETYRDLEKMAPSKRDAIPPPPPPGKDAWVTISSDTGTILSVRENEDEARRLALHQSADAVRYVPASRLEAAEEQLRRVADFYGSASKCACGEKGCNVDMTPGAECLRCAACGADRDGTPVQRAAYDRLRAALEDIVARIETVSTPTEAAAVSVARAALDGRPWARCTGVVVSASSDRCGNTGTLQGGRACPGCRSCA